ncbi:hypothetical protein V8G54_025171, partial [Vigna mungo]
MSSTPPPSPKNSDNEGPKTENRVHEATDPTMNPSSPFFIHPSEGPSSVSITPVLDGTNYQSWSRAIRMVLISKNKMAFLLGTIPVPKVEEPIYSAWERCNTLVMSWLLNSVTPSIAQSVIFLECAIDIWNDLRERFSQGDLLRIAALQEEIYGLSQGICSGVALVLLPLSKEPPTRNVPIVTVLDTLLTCVGGKHGYPPGHPRYPGRPKFNRDASGSYSINNAIVIEPTEGGNGSEKEGGPITLTHAQYQTLMSLLQPQQQKNASDVIGPNSLVQPNRMNLIHTPNAQQHPESS